ncbi:MAG: hypothetical protein ACRERD_13380, partial [Candidatus Binatia bacterium]
MNQHGWFMIMGIALAMSGCSLGNTQPERGGHASLQQRPAAGAAAAPTAKPGNQAEVQRKLAGLSIPFIAHQGQRDARVTFSAPTFGGTVYVTPEGEIVYALPGPRPAQGPERAASGQWSVASPTALVFNPPSTIPTPRATGVVLREELVGARVQAVQGEGQTRTQVNLLHGNDPSKWQRHLPTYASVSLGEAYGGVTVKLRAYGQTVEKLFYVQPGAKPEQIRIKLQGGQGVKVTEAGELEVGTELGAVRFSKPVAYQETAGQKQWIEVAYA